MIKIILLLMCFLSFSVFSQAQHKEGTDHRYYTSLFLRAIDGEPDAMFEVANTLSNKDHTLYHPKKGHEYYTKLARLGDSRAMLPLIDIFIDPTHPEYSPSRAWFYAQRTESISPLKRRFIQFLSGNIENITMLDSDLPSDPFYPVVYAFSFFPFINLSSQHWQSVTPYFNHPSLKPYLSYILPIMYSPTVDGRSLYPSQRNGIYTELVNQHGYYIIPPNQAQISQVSIVQKDHGVERLRLFYPASDNQSARLAHYAAHYQQYFDLLTQSTDKVKLQGHHLNLTIAVVNDFITVDYFYPEQPLLREKARVN